MRALIQRVSEASVIINKKVKAKIPEGMLIFLGIENDDTIEDITYLTYKITRMRIFADKDGKMNRSIHEIIPARIMVISQFTLFADSRKGNRPSFVRAARPEFARMMYEMFILQLEKETNNPIASGEFGADMKIHLVNDGPITIWLDSKLRDY
ncbi:MAG: D-tyrosyl-tRNA(Tyr) deacylase [Candidatus Competibacteraceae bacterium]|nr:D-tyrosyl-tRNA(Tyr) deacylase [Candidatus Competibacteraceae bacterium]